MEKTKQIKKILLLVAFVGIYLFISGDWLLCQ